MFSTRTRRPWKPSPNHELIHHGNIRETRLPERNPPRRGFSTFIHALAFSTLLSSQETDAHLRRNFRSLPGQPLNLTLEFLSCQLRFRKLSRSLRRFHYGLSRHQGSPSVSLEAAALALRAHKTFGS